MKESLLYWEGSTQSPGQVLGLAAHFSEPFSPLSV
jgi:hypothetical protein